MSVHHRMTRAHSVLCVEAMKSFKYSEPPSPAQHKNRFEGDTVRLNRKWLYLGGLVTILTLLLTLTLVLPAGAVGQLDRGSLDTDDGYVSPDPDVEDGDMIEVTLTNAGLDITSTVENDGDFGPVTLDGRSMVTASAQ